MESLFTRLSTPERESGRSANSDSPIDFDVRNEVARLLEADACKSSIDLRAMDQLARVSEEESERKAREADLRAKQDAREHADAILQLKSREEALRRSRPTTPAPVSLECGNVPDRDRNPPESDSD